MDAVQAHLSFKVRALIIALSTGMKNSSTHQVIPRNVQHFVSNILRETFTTQSRLGNLQSPETTMTV
jgi:hypothetical protein